MDDGTEFSPDRARSRPCPVVMTTWVVGDSPVVTVDWFGASSYANDSESK